VIYVLYAIHIMVCLFLILVVLLQQGKGADLSVFGGGATQAAFGARGAATLLHKLTVGGFVAFIVTTMTIGLMQGHSGSSSVMSDVAVEEPAAVEESAPAAQPDSPAEAFAAAAEAGDEADTEAGEATGEGAQSAGEAAASGDESPPGE
jgi:preprotein translocase subunit SecG